MTKGPEIEGIISARGDGRMQIRTADGNNTMIAITENTRIKSSGGFLGLSRNKLAADSLINVQTVSVETLKRDGGLWASKVELNSNDIRTASMITTGKAQHLAEQPSEQRQADG